MKFDLSRIGEFEYYSKMLLKIRTAYGLEDFDFTKRYVQREIDKEWERFVKKKEPVALIILKARRHGVTTYVQSRMFHGCHTIPHRQSMTIAADDEGSSYIHKMSQTFYDYLPQKLRPATKQKNIHKMVFDYPKTRADREGVNLGLKSELKTVTCTNKAGLGTGNHYIHFSEYAMYRDAEGVRKAVMPTAFDVPGTFVIIESTANGVTGEGEPFYEEWKRAKAGKSIFKPLFYSWTEHEDYRRPFKNDQERQQLLDTLDSEERELIEIHKVTLEQLNWRRRTIWALGEHGHESTSGVENFHEQYPTTDDEAFVVSGRSVFNRSILKLYKNQVKEPIRKCSIIGGKIVEDYDGELSIWKDPIPGAEYIASIDPASGEPGSTDYGCIEVFRIGDVAKSDYGEQVAEWHGRVDADDLGNIAQIIGHRYNVAMLAPEIFGYGHAVLKALVRDSYPLILRRVQMDAISKKYTNKLGWNTNQSTKPSMLTLGRFVVNNKMVRIYSEPLVDEMIMFVRDSGGSGASAYGRGKDDRVMAFLIVLMAIQQEYADTNPRDMGVDSPVSVSEVSDADKKDPLKYDDWWDKHPGGLPKSKHWTDL